MKQLNFVGLDIPSTEDLQNCVHCGFCLPSCPTYLATGHELESPRGRLHVIAGIKEGRIDANSRTLQHLDRCLQCRACETACPSAVPYGRIMEDARASIMANRNSRQPRSWFIRSFLLRNILSHQKRLRFAISLGRFYSKSGLQNLIRGPLKKILPMKLVRLENSLPSLHKKPFRESGMLSSPEGSLDKVALLTGCIHGEIYPEMHTSTVEVLDYMNFQVIAPKTQVCCGALHIHAGDAEASRKLARQNIEIFESSGASKVLVNAAGCGSAMKEYGRLLRHDEKWRARAEIFSAKVEDILEFVAKHKFDRQLGEVREVVTLQDACHLAHAQKEKLAPRTILSSIPGLELREMNTPDRCCGSAGIYSIVQPDLSSQVLSAKLEDVLGTDAGTVCTANPGCTLQLEAGLRRESSDMDVRHVIELLAKSVRLGRDKKE
jgi:glycolate oxidase iron-sulfur subunit